MDVDAGKPFGGFDLGVEVEVNQKLSKASDDMAVSVSMEGLRMGETR